MAFLNPPGERYDVRAAWDIELKLCGCCCPGLIEDTLPELIATKFLKSFTTDHPLELSLKAADVGAEKAPTKAPGGSGSGTSRRGKDKEVAKGGFAADGTWRPEAGSRPGQRREMI